MDRRKKIESELDAALALLAALPKHEVDEGWNEPLARTWTKILSALREAIVCGRPLSHQYKNVVFSRGLDMEGICGGHAFDLAVAIGTDLRALIAEEEATSCDAN